MSFIPSGNERKGGALNGRRILERLVVALPKKLSPPTT